MARRHFHGFTKDYEYIELIVQDYYHDALKSEDLVNVINDRGDIIQVIFGEIIDLKEESNCV